MNKYKKFRNFFTSIKRKSEKNYYEIKFMEAKNLTKQNWDVINFILNKKKNVNSIDKLFVDNNLIEDKQNICDALNAYYLNVVNTLLKDNNISCTDNLKPKPNSIKPVQNSIFLDSTNVEEVLSIVKQMNNKKSTSDDSLSSYLIKHIITEISIPITHIYNLSLSQGIFPKCFKISKVIPIYKKGNREEPGNYRPISLLSPLSKILEKLVLLRVKSFLDTHKFSTTNSTVLCPTIPLI